MKTQFVSLFVSFLNLFTLSFYTIEQRNGGLVFSKLYFPPVIQLAQYIGVWLGLIDTIFMIVTLQKVYLGLSAKLEFSQWQQNYRDAYIAKIDSMRS